MKKYAFRQDAHRSLAGHITQQYLYPGGAGRSACLGEGEGFSFWRGGGGGACLERALPLCMHPPPVKTLPSRDFVYGW